MKGKCIQKPGVGLV